MELYIFLKFSSFFDSGKHIIFARRRKNIVIRNLPVLLTIFFYAESDPDPVLVCPDPVLVCPDPVLFCPDPVLFCPDPVFVCPDPVFVCPDPISRNLG